jgi:hypothetical protein
MSPETALAELLDDMLPFAAPGWTADYVTVRSWRNVLDALIQGAGPSDVERYDHATAVSRGEEIGRLHAFIAACAERGELRASQVAVDAHKGVRVQFGFDQATLECVVPALFQGAGHVHEIVNMPSSVNEGILLRRLSDVLTGGNAGTWDEVIHAAEVLQGAGREGEPKGHDAT